MKCAIMSGGSGTLLLGIMLCWPVGAAEMGGRVTEPEVDLVSVVAQGLQSPLYLTHAGDGSGQLFVVEQSGTIRVIVQGILQDKPFLDITNRVLSGGERGLLGLAFHPNHRKNGRFFVNYTRRDDGATVLAVWSAGPESTGLDRGTSADGRASAVCESQWWYGGVWTGWASVYRSRRRRIRRRSAESRTEPSGAAGENSPHRCGRPAALYHSIGQSIRARRWPS